MVLYDLFLEEHDADDAVNASTNDNEISFVANPVFMSLL